MIKHLLEPTEIQKLAEEALGTQLDLVKPPMEGVASGVIVPITLAPGIVLLHGSLRGLRAVSAIAESQPGLNVEIRVQGRSDTYNADERARAFTLEPGQILIRGGAKAERWKVSLPSQARFDTVSLIFSIQALESLATIAPEPASRLLHWVNVNHARLIPATQLMICLAERALVMHPYDTNAPLKGYALAMELLAEVQAAVLEDRPRRAGNDIDIGLVEQARALISCHPTVALGPDDLAQHCFVSRSRLKAAFRNASEQSIATAIRSAALTEAKRLLLDGVNVSNVATLVGYQTPEGFSKAFHQLFGLSPRAFVRITDRKPY